MEHRTTVTQAAAPASASRRTPRADGPRRRTLALRPGRAGVLALPGRDRLTHWYAWADHWRDQLVADWRHRQHSWCHRMARAWYARAASDQVMSGPRLGREVAGYVVGWLATRLQNYRSPRPRPPRRRLFALADQARKRTRRLRHPTGPPPAGRLFGMCGWSFGLALLGLPIAGRALLTVIAGARPDWLHPSMALGVIGIVLAVLAFVTIHRRRLPWLLLGSATLMLILTTRLD